MILDVHADLDEARTTQLEAQRPNAAKAAARLADERRDLTCDLERRTAQVDVESDEWPACADEHGACTRIELGRTEVRRELAGSNTLA